MSGTPTDLNAREFLDELAQLSASLRQEIEAFQLGLDPAPAAVAERRRRVLRDQDFRFFAYTYFPHHIRGEPSAFQAAFCHRFPQVLANATGCQEWWVAPRGECKSSLATKIGPCWIAVQGLLQREAVRRRLGLDEAPPFLDYVLLLGAETKFPTKLLEVVRTELECNPALALDFPEVARRGPSWKVGELVTATGVKIEPFGAEQAVRGTFHGASRPKVLLPDDILTDKEAKSPTERDNRWNWVNRAVDFLGPPDGSVKLIGVGTILNKDDVISRAKKSVGHVVHHFKAIERYPTYIDLWEECENLMRNDDARLAADAVKRGADVVADHDLPSYRFYKKHRRKMDLGARTSWPAVRGLYWLMRQRAKNARAFGTEMQGEPRADEDRVFEHITFWVRRLQHWIWFGACDPSQGKQDPSALLVGGLDTETAQLHVVAAEIKMRVESKLLADLCALQREYSCQAWAFENNNAYDYMRKSFIREANRDSLVLPLTGVTAKVAPEVRIDSLEPDVNAGRILFRPELLRLLEELEDWPEPQTHHHYDGLVALHLLWHIAISRSQRLPRLPTAGPRQSRGGIPWGNYYG